MRQIRVITALLSVAMLLTTVNSVEASKKQATPTKTHTKVVTSSKVKATKPSVTIPSSKVVYKKPTPTIKATYSLPKSHTVVKRNGINFYISNGKYYRRDANRYIAVAPPIGLRVSVLPVGFVMLTQFATALYYYDGVYYEKSGSAYQVVEAPDEVIVTSLPEETELVTIDDKTYYIYGGNVYSVVYTPDGKVFKLTGNLEM